MKTYVGIDNGKSGAVAMIFPGGEVEVAPMPMLEFERRILFDDIKLMQMLNRAKANPDGMHVVFELGQIQPLWSAKANHIQGLYMGTVTTLIRQHNLPATGVNPKDWQSLMLASFPKHWDTKVKSIASCQQRYPKVNLIPPRCRNVHDGYADALNMAEWGRLKGL